MKQTNKQIIDGHVLFLNCLVFFFQQKYQSVADTMMVQGYFYSGEKRILEVSYSCG